MKIKPKGLAMTLTAVSLFLTPALWAAGSGEAAQNAEAIVVTATATEKTLKEVPGVVEIITRQDIEDMNALTLADAVENATGLIVRTESGRNKRASIRGTNTKHTLILIDGRRLASGFKTYTGMEQIPAEMIDHIEVARGTASALYGSDAIGGVINVITKKTPKAFALEASAQAGQTGYGEGGLGVGQAMIGTRSGQVGFLLSGSARSKDGYDRDGVTPDDMDDTQMGALAGRASYDISPDHHLLSGFEYLEKNSTGLRDLESMDRERDADDERLNLFLEYNGKPTQASNLMLRANHSQHEADVEVTPATSGIAGAVGDEGHAQRRLDQLEGRFNLLCFDRHLLTFGAEGREEAREDDDGLVHSITNASALVQDEYQVTDKLYFLFGGRVDEHSDFGSNFTPRASVTFAFTDHFRIKGSAAKGFRAPDINELYITEYKKRGKLIYQSNKNLEPEKSVNYELSLEGEIQQFHGRITGFQNDIENLIEAVFDYSTGSGKKKKSYYTYQNVSEARIRGVELEAGVDLPYGFDLSGNLTFLDAENKETGVTLESRPVAAGQAKLGYTDRDLGLRTSFRIVYNGESEASEEQNQAVTRADFRVSKILGRQMELFAGVNNIFNSYIYEGQEPIFFYTGLKFTY